jgi:N6-adenosine-specific RNA methylase IME4
MSVIEAWGFLYRTCAVWVKDRIGMGYYFRQQHELLLVATRGNPAPPAPSDRVTSIISAPRLEHSAKPQETYEIIERMYPKATRIELFARNERDGWAAWGNEIPGA